MQATLLEAQKTTSRLLQQITPGGCDGGAAAAALNLPPVAATNLAPTSATAAAAGPAEPARGRLSDASAAAQQAVCDLLLTAELAAADDPKDAEDYSLAGEALEAEDAAMLKKAKRLKSHQQDGGGITDAAVTKAMVRALPPAPPGGPP